MTSAYCKFLYDPSALGNLEVIRPKGNIKILQGETNNDFSQVVYHYAKAKVARKDFLPKELRTGLKDLNYFKKLAELLDRPPLQLMSFDERVRYDRLNSEVDRIWESALDETVLGRMKRKYPGIHQIRNKEMPPEYDIEYQKERRNLLTQVSKALWKEDKNWAKVIETFQHLQEAYNQVIDRLDIDRETRAQFHERIQSVKLVLPGSIPEIADYECSSTTANAYYYKYLNIITVCAGDFNSEDILQTLAHELGHSLDVSRFTYLFKMKSELAQKQSGLRRQVCQEKKIECDQWEDFKKKLPERLAIFGQFKPELQETNQCLKRRPVLKTPTGEDYSRIAKNMTTSIYSSLAGGSFFLRIIKDQLPLRNGKLVKNPYYLDPCQYFLWTKEEEPPEDEINSLTYFTAEYSCQKLNNSEAFKKAIEVSKAMTEQVYTKMLQVSGQFSSNEFLVKEGFASSPVERFADVMGSAAVAEYMKRFPQVSDRRGKLLASVSWLCSEPSLKSRFPEESQIESDYSNDPHTDGFSRFQEILSAPLRESMQCRKDFTFSECALPMKSEQ